MALTKSTLPAIVPTIATPYDTSQAFAAGQTLTASGYFNSVNTQLNIGPGRVDGLFVINATAVDFSSGDETYRVLLLGSNDVAWGNGNVDVLCVWDAAAVTAGRILATICAATPAIPATGTTATKIVKPFLNQVGDYVFQYQQCYAILGGTTPSITATVWMTYDTLG